MKAKAIKLVSCCKYEIVIFALLCIQALINILPFYGMSKKFYVYYLSDFSMGTASRMWVGSIVKLLTDHPTEKWVCGFAFVTLFIALLFSAILVGGVIRKSNDEMKPILCIFALLFSLGSFTLHGFSRFFGMLDIHMFILALLAVVFLQNKYLRWFVPVICAIGVFINFVFAISYFLFIILVAFYLVVTQEKKLANSAVFAISAAVTVILTLYCIILGPDSMKVTFEQMREIMEQKSGHKLDDWALTNYFGFYFFDMAPEEVGLSAEQVSQLSLVGYVKEFIKYSVGTKFTLNGVISLVSLALPTVAVFWVIWGFCIRNSETAGRRFVYFCFLAFTIFIPVTCMMSTDPIRWVQAGVITQFGLVFFMFFMEDEPFIKTMRQFKSFFETRKILMIALAALVAVYVFTYQQNLSA